MGMDFLLLYSQLSYFDNNRYYACFRLLKQINQVLN